ncbi:AAA family ATPase [Kribbella sp. NPDC051620]|uniref:helix-turn-helix transcriptional regulator n=1 Tax=Kribbella sp. NPDC051620 TaxID=3364120 RepID=UPI0037B7841F
MTLVGPRSWCQESIAAPEFVGRSLEASLLRRLVRDARAGGSAALVVRGPTGIGKTALFDSVVAEADGFRVVRLRAVATEANFPGTGLQLLGDSLADGTRDVPSLTPTLGLFPADGSQQRRELGERVRRLLDEGSARRPLLCVLDDAHWFDEASAQVLVYALRRLAGGCVFLLAEREEYTSRLADLPSLALGRLSYADLRMLVSAVVPGGVDEVVAGRVIREARGNPRLLLESLQGVSPAAFAGGYAVPGTTRANSSAEPPTGLMDLPEEGRRLLLLASADPTGDASLLRRAARTLGLSLDAVAALESAGMMRLGVQVLFGSPALRMWCYQRATEEQRREVHRALATATDGHSTADRRAWHLAQAAEGSDEELATELERTATTAQQRGGPAAAAAFLELAASLTTDVALRSSRALTAAAAKREAGDPDAAAQLLTVVDTSLSDPLLQWRLEYERARLMFATSRGQAAVDCLLRAAETPNQLDTPAADNVRFEAAVAAALTAGNRRRDQYRPASRYESTAVATSTPDGLFLAGLSARHSGAGAETYRLLRAGVDAVQRADSELETPEWLWLVAWVARDLWDDDASAEFSARSVRRGQDNGDLARLPHALFQQALTEIHQGDLRTARALARRSEWLSGAIGSPPLSAGSLLVTAWLGDEPLLGSMLDSARRDAGHRGEGLVLAAAGLAEAVLNNALGRYDVAFVAAFDVVRDKPLGLVGPGLAELIEAAVRSGQLKEAAEALDVLSEQTRAAGTDWALGVEARSRALLAPGNLGESLYLEAIERLRRCRGRTEYARTQLLYGEWLRRQGRRIDARPHLRAAHRTFTEIGAVAFAERAHREQLATGEKARSRSVDALVQLTPQELRVAMMAREGLTNPEIGTRLFISPRTVEYHLHKVFDKLGIASRSKLHLALDHAAIRTSRGSSTDSGATG